MKNTNTEEYREGIRQKIQDLINEVSDGGGLVTEWVTVVEWMDTSGDKWISRIWSDTMTMWQREGMLRYGIKMDDRLRDK